MDLPGILKIAAVCVYGGSLDQGLVDGGEGTYNPTWCWQSEATAQLRCCEPWDEKIVRPKGALFSFFPGLIMTCEGWFYFAKPCGSGRVKPPSSPLCCPYPGIGSSQLLFLL